jgi:hypothetical protein
MIGLVPMGGAGGRVIRPLQWLNGDGFADFEHAFAALPGNMIIEAEPGGARIVPLRYQGVHWCEGIYRLLPAAADVTGAADALKGVPYSWLDYGALFAHRLRIPVPGLRGFIAASGHQICSQLADELYLRLGAHIFQDGRWPGYCTPGSLYQRDLQLRKGNG